MCGGIGSIIAKGGSNVNPCVKAKLKRPLLGCRGRPAQGAERPEPAALLPRQRLASRHRVAGGQAQPAHEVPLRRERRQIRPDLGHDRARRPRADAVDVRQVRRRVAVQRGADLLLSPRLDGLLLGRGQSSSLSASQACCPSSSCNFRS